MRRHADKNSVEVFRVVFMRVCGIYGQNSMLLKSRKGEVFPNRLFRPHGYWAERGCCWNGLPDEKGIETRDEGLVLFAIEVSLWMEGRKR